MRVFYKAGFPAMIRRFFAKVRVLPHLIFFSLIVFQTVFACEVQDDTGQIIKLAHPAQRIVSLAPDLTEILFAIGAGKRVVGVIRGSDYPLPATHLPVIANYTSIDSEAVLALQPDLIVAWLETGFARQLKKLGIPVYFSRQQQLMDIPVTFQKLGCLAGTEYSAKQATENFLQRYYYLKQKYSHKKTISVFYQVWSKPLITITKNSWMNDVLMLCGANNIFSDLKGSAPEVTVEAVISADPAIIMGSDTQCWQSESSLSAVRNHYLFSIDASLIERAGPRVVEGAEMICKLVDKARI